MTATRTITSTTDALLRFAMRLDAILTGLCGLAVSAFANPVASLTGLTPTQAYVFGGAFVLYGLVVFGLAALEQVRRAGAWVIAANVVATIVATIGAVAAGALSLTGAGAVVMLAMAAYTTAFALLQYLGVRRLA